MDSRDRRLVPFLVAAIILFIVCLALFRLPEAFVSRIGRNTPFTASQTGWAYRLLVFAALAQAIYGGFWVLQVDKVRKARAEDEKTAALSQDDLMQVISRNAAIMALLSLVYGLAAFYVGGERGGFWLFAFLTVAQGAWYFRQVGQIGKWLYQQPAVEATAKPSTAWEREPPDYSPPLGRG